MTRRNGEKGQPAGGLGQPPELQAEQVLNPFRNDSQFEGAYEFLKTLVLLPVALLRGVLFVTALVLAYCLTKIALLGAKNVLTKPFPKWRRVLLLPVRLCSRIMLFACGYHWIHVKGKPAPRHEAPILVSNHVSFADPLFIFFRHLPVIVTAHENLSIPVAGAIMRAMQVIAVHRDSPDSRHNALGAIKRKAMCNDWNHVMIFPEATTTNGKALVSFKAGAFTPGYAVQPMLMRYPHVNIDPSWVAEGPVVHWLLFRLMTQFHNFMSVEYLPVIHPTQAEQKNPQAFAERVRVTMAQALNISVTRHTYEDAALVMEAVKLKLDSKAAILEFGKFEKLYQLQVKILKHWLHKFLAMDPTKRGIVTYQDFIRALDLPDCALLGQIFSYFDRSEQGSINFSQYVAGVAFIAKHKKFKEAIEATFKFCGGDGDGLLDKTEARSSFREVIPSITNQQIHVLFDKMDAKKAGIISRGDFAHFIEGNPEYLLIFLIAKPDLLEFDKDFLNVDRQLTD
ncbi:unnamed protein product [Sphagnum balticum]